MVPCRTLNRLNPMSALQDSQDPSALQDSQWDGVAWEDLQLMSIAAWLAGQSERCALGGHFTLSHFKSKCRRKLMEVVAGQRSVCPDFRSSMAAGQQERDGGLAGHLHGVNGFHLLLAGQGGVMGGNGHALEARGLQLHRH